MYSQKWRLYRVDTEQKQDIRKATVTTSKGEHGTKDTNRQNNTNNL